MAGQLLDNAQGSGFPKLMVTQGQTVLERTLAEIVLHTTAVLSCVGQNTLLEPLRQLMEDPAAMNVIVDMSWLNLLPYCILVSQNQIFKFFIMIRNCKI